jgi:transposase
MPRVEPLSAEPRQKIEDFLLAGMNVKEIAQALKYRVSERHSYKMKQRLEGFGSVKAPCMSKRGRPRTLTPEMQEAVVEFVIEYDKQATLEEIGAMLQEEFEEFEEDAPAAAVISRALKEAKITQKVVEREAFQRNEILRTRLLLQGVGVHGPLGQ